MERMRRTRLLLVALTAVIAARAPRAAPPTPIVVELFTSEGCSDCPPADLVLQKLVDAQSIGGAEIIGLGEHVDYWDRLGWKDRFSSSALTKRQLEYADHFGGNSMYTPQMVVDGRAEFIGSDASAATRAIEKLLAQPHATIHLALDGVPAITSSSVSVVASASDLPHVSRGDRAELLLVVIEDGLRSDVKHGENQGRTLAHAAVVRYMATVGVAGDPPVRAEIPLGSDWQRTNLKVVALAQEQKSRTILGSASMALKNAR
jgi:hypothetical protein